MAREADFGLMIWGGKSAGTILNVLRLVKTGKIAVLFSVPEKKACNVKTPADWEAFLSRCDDQLLRELRSRTTADEWRPAERSLFDAPKWQGEPSKADEDCADLNAALASGDPARVAMLSAASPRRAA